MKPWRENAVPHRDVLEGTFQQSEFAADITAVHTGKATREYQDAAAFFERTFITEGMRVLLTQVAQRLAGRGGEPVIQLQTAFGGGKTHTMLAVYHLATRKVPLADLAGVPSLVEKAGLMEVPPARVAVLDGNAHSPGQPWKRGKQAIATLWGDLAWQLGGVDAYSLLRDSDATGTSPGKEMLRDLLAAHAPCVVFIDELVAYVRQFPDKALSGGTYDSNLSFVMALTEAAKLVPAAIVLASLPESDVEAGSDRGVKALRALEKTFGRVQALWKPVASEEAFEIVRRRLFEPIRDERVRDAVCRAFADAYVAEGARLPAETQEARYRERLSKAYPIHPEVFDRIYGDWSSIEGFQRTRGVLKLMAKVIYCLWRDNNQDLMILPGSLPLYDASTLQEMVYLLPPGWDPVVEGDIDGDGSETVQMENRESRFGGVQAARRVARTLFLGTAPASVAAPSGGKGLDRAHILLGSLQPGQPSSVYSDALNRMADVLHYLNSSGDKSHDTTRFWFDVRANLRREMEDRKRRFDEKAEVQGHLAQVLKKMVTHLAPFQGVHVFTPHADVPDDSALRLVVLPPDCWYAKEEPREAFRGVLEAVDKHGTGPRHRGNRLLFLGPDKGVLARLKDAARTALAWGSIVDDINESRLNVDLLQKKQAEKELQSAEDLLPRVARETYRWLLAPHLEKPTDPKPTVEAYPLNTAGGSIGSEIERVTRENELIITAWSPIHLRSRLREFYWTNGAAHTVARSFWDDSLRYLYLPRLLSQEVLAQAIRQGAATRDFFGTARGQAGDRYEGFQFGSADVELDDTLLLIDPLAAAAYIEAHPVVVPIKPPGPGPGPGPDPDPDPWPVPPVPKPKLSRAFHATAHVKPATAKVHLVGLAEELIAVLCSDPNASVTVTLEVAAEFPHGASDTIVRATTENARTLGVTADWE